MHLIINTILDNVLIHRNLVTAIEWRQQFTQKGCISPPIITIDGWGIDRSGLMHQLQSSKFVIGTPDITQTQRWANTLAIAEKMIYCMAIYTIMSFQQYKEKSTTKSTVPTTNTDNTSVTTAYINLT